MVDKATSQQQKYQVAFINNGQTTFTLVFVNYAVITDDKMVARSIAALKKFFTGGDVVLVAMDITQQPHFAGARELVQGLQGRKITDFKWQTAVVG